MTMISSSPGQTDMRNDNVAMVKDQGQNSQLDSKNTAKLWQLLRPGALLGPTKSITEIPGAILGALTVMLYLAWTHPRKSFHQAAMRRMKYGADADVSLPSAPGQALQFLLIGSLGGLWLWGMPKRNLDWVLTIGPAVLASVTAWASVTLWKRDAAGGRGGKAR